jgi:histidinol-phosphate aminotransferase
MSEQNKPTKWAYPEVKYQDTAIRMAQNENPYGPAPSAIKALEGLLTKISRYPALFPNQLITKLANKLNVAEDTLILEVGSIGVIERIFKSIIKRDENIVTAKVTFIAYSLLARIYGIGYKEVEMEGNTLDLEHLLEHCDSKTRAVFLANPNNPTGTIFSHDELHTFLIKIPENILVVLDEAYIEYVTEKNAPRSLELLSEFNNLVVLRTFSKVYGLAGLRIGYGISHVSIIEELKKVNIPFCLNAPALTAAYAALDDEDYVKECAARNDVERNLLYQKLVEMDYNVIVSQANFLYVDFCELKETLSVLELLTTKGIQVRQLTAFGNENALRMTVGRPEENVQLLKCLAMANAEGYAPIE